MARKIFISYTHQDTRFVIRLARHLKKNGLSIWLDQWHVALDDDWNRAIATAVNNCDSVLLVLSPQSRHSWLVQEQVMQAMQRGKPIVTVLCSPCQPPQILQSGPSFNLTGRAYRSGLQKLLSHYLPNQNTDVKRRLNLLPLWHRARDELARFWRVRLGPLLFPGWLGPVLVLVSLLAFSLYWTRLSDSPATLPTRERLAIVMLTSTPTRPLISQKTRVRAADRKVQVFVPAGEFLRGSTTADQGAGEDEHPQRQVYLDAFWIDRTEITNAEYGECVAAGACSRPTARNRNFAAALLPVVGVNWQQAATYCHWVGARLPTEAEWEKAARGTDGRRYPWGNFFDGRRLNYCDTNCVADWRDRNADDGFRYTAPVGTYPDGASPYGALDMSGNVWEWTADWYAPDAYLRAASRNPAGPAAGQQRVIRGGSWYYKGSSLRVTRRQKDVPTSSYDNIGFRCLTPEVDTGQTGSKKGDPPPASRVGAGQPGQP